MQGVWQDIKHGARMLVKAPAITAVAILSLALGIAANTSVFTLINSMLLKPLPVEEQDRLVRVFTSYPSSPHNSSSAAEYRDLAERNEVFSGLAAYFFFPMSLKSAETADVVTGHIVSWNYFDVLGVKPILGRSFLREEDDGPGSRPVVILSHRAWHDRFGGDPDMVGRTLLVNGHLREIRQSDPADPVGRGTADGHGDSNAG